MNLILVGLSHKTAPIEIRENLAISEEALGEALQALKADFGVQEGLIISTCNRVEIIAGTSNGDGLERVKNFIYRYHSMSPPALEPFLYARTHGELVRHVFRVACSLDSMVVGESQILGQLKQAFATAREAGSVGVDLNRLMPRAFFVAKRVRTETRVGGSAVSISHAAVELARKIFGNLEDKSVLLIGAGKMSELAAQSLLNAGASRIFITNRTNDRSLQLASRFGGTPVPFQELPAYLLQSDIVIVSTGADSFVLDKEMLSAAIRKRKYSPLFVIDISVPRNVDPQVNDIENIFLYDIDDLQTVIQSNLQERQREAETAEVIVDEEVRRFLEPDVSGQTGALLAALRERMEEICLHELEQNRSRLAEAEYDRQRRQLIRAARRLAHPFILEIKRNQGKPEELRRNLELLQRVLQLRVDK